METLSNEMLLHVLSFCGAKELCNLSLVDKTLLNLTHEESFWKTLCQQEKFPEKEEKYSWREWYQKMSSPFRVECHWYYGAFQYPVFEINYGTTFGQLCECLCKEVGYDQPKNVTIGVDGGYDDIIPEKALSKGLFICWVRG
ncbi:hypothetical protein LAU_0166 [Lausannevirus]|uniref:F-box domain-containing protein n=2 Tax=Lausannevirus TaxID=999883 RepID=A0A0N9PM00_9VIRU|nr:hypothetical protein LAU_0166 [Lausannevirus]AEA07017.1 hypothetical protein LAU_0166 [Lausannevirus]ALH06843.1 hypothetical protein PMV_145 [Port-miou virus]